MNNGRRYYLYLFSNNSWPITAWLYILCDQDLVVIYRTLQRIYQQVLKSTGYQKEPNLSICKGPPS